MIIFPCEQNENNLEQFNFNIHSGMLHVLKKKWSRKFIMTGEGRGNNTAFLCVELATDSFILKTTPHVWMSVVS